jgi:hypothetical protein
MIYAQGDQIRVRATNVTQLDASDVAQPVTSGLAGTLHVRNWHTDAAVSGPHVLANAASGDDWYVDITAPMAEGEYRLVVVLSKGGAQRTLHGRLEVKANPPT